MITRKPTENVPTRNDSNWPVQPYKMTRDSFVLDISKFILATVFIFGILIGAEVDHLINF